MRKEIDFQKVVAVSTGILALGVCIYFINLASSLILYLIFAYFFVTFFRGVADWARRKFDFPRSVTYLILSIFILSGLVLFSFIIAETVRDFISVQDLYKDLLALKIDALETRITQITQTAKLDLRNEVRSFPIKQFLGGVFNNTVGIFQILITFFVFVIAEFFENYARIAEKLKLQKSHLYKVMNNFQASIQRYLVIKTFISMGTALFVYAILTFFSVDFALLWALFTFLLNYIPVVGSIIATVLPLTIVWVTKDLGVFFVIFAILTVNQVFWGQYLDPKIVGDQFNLKFKTILVSIFLWGSLFGIGGVVLAPLLTLALKLISEGYPDWEWFSVIVSQRHEKSLK